MKRFIDGILLALGLVLVATGGWWMWTGWDVVQVERGWVAVISGSIMMTGGFVVVAIACAIMRLQPVGTVLAMDQAISPASPSETSYPAAPAPEAPPHAPSFGGAAIGGAAIVAGATAVAGVGAASAFGKAADEPEPAEPDDADIEPEAEPLGWPTPEPPKAPSTNRLSISNLLRRNAPPPPVAPPQPEPAFDDVARDEESHVGIFNEESEIDDAVDGDAEPPPLPPAGPIFPRSATVEEKPAPVSTAPHSAEESDAEDDEGDWFDQAERSLDRALARAPGEPGSATESAPQPAIPAKPAAVTGRYSSGDTNYIMFDDGSIEAQTPEGVMRFDSLVELRRFVEQRK